MKVPSTPPSSSSSSHSLSYLHMLFVPIPHPLAGDKNNGVECYDGGDNEDDDDGDGDGDGGNDDDGDLADVQQAARCRLRRRHHKYGHVGGDRFIEIGVR